MNGVAFANPGFFYALLVIPAFAIWYFFRYNSRKASLRISNFNGFSGNKTSLKVYFRHSLFVLRMLALAALILALARPQSKKSWQDLKTEGIDIVLTLDISASMLAQDFKPNRLDASKEIAMEFIDSRPDDRIGLVIFSGESFTQCPLTTDHSVLKNLFSGVKTGMIQDGTAIGMGLATAVNRIQNSKAKSKVIILLTDGVNNTGSVSPELAGELAQPFGIRVYTIGVGTKGMAYSPVAIYPNGQYAYDYVKCDIDEPVLKKIASLTGGKYFRATNNEKLKQIYAEIDQLEKTIIEEKNYTKKSELFLPLALLALFLLVLEFGLKNTVFRSLT
ncbi:MAG TPA: VWA domain-containing protein [Bacteroidia bacterium]|nr:VWA domain-containing protein [Bacteroidia bacterium]HRH08377.1 VWA domain-containing protein [Bacteroidia bacterium]